MESFVLIDRRCRCTSCKGVLPARLKVEDAGRFSRRADPAERGAEHLVYLLPVIHEEGIR